MNKCYSVIVTALAVILLLCLVWVVYATGYINTLLVRFHLKDPSVSAFGVGAWSTCLEQLHDEVDVAFFGDSLTQYGEWDTYFPDQKVANLGMGGDMISSLRRRIPMLEAVSPKKAFVMIGTNALKDDNVAERVAQYEELLDALIAALPDAEIYVQSVLPVSAEREKSAHRHNTTIQSLNREIKLLSEERGITFIDLYSLYEDGGYLNSAYTKDGLHLTPEGYAPWADAISPYINE